MVWINDMDYGLMVYLWFMFDMIYIWRGGIWRVKYLFSKYSFINLSECI